MSRYAKGGVIPGPPITEDVKVKLSEDRRCYWEPERSRWVAILTPADVAGYGRQALQAVAEADAADHERADDYERNHHK